MLCIYRCIRQNKKIQLGGICNSLKQGGNVYCFTALCGILTLFLKFNIYSNTQNVSYVKLTHVFIDVKFQKVVAKM